MNWKENCRKRKSNGETQREAENWAISCKLQGRMTNGIFSSSVSVPYFGISNFHCLFFLFCFFFGVYNPLGQLYGHDIWRCNHIATGKNIIGPLIQNAWGCFCSTEHTFTSTSRSSEYVIYSCPGLVSLFLNKLNCFPSLLLWCCWSNLTWSILVVCEKISVCV